MKALKLGSKYLLFNYNSEEGQTIQFTERKPEGGYVPGTTNEEVVSMMIDRMYSLQKRSPSAENQVVLILFKQIKKLFAQRLESKKSFLTRKRDAHYSQQDAED